MTNVVDALGSGRRATLEAIRGRLAEILDGAAGHERGCECECGAPFDAGKMAPVARELREVLRELDDLPDLGSGESEIERARTARENRRRQAQANATEG